MKAQRTGLMHLLLLLLVLSLTGCSGSGKSKGNGFVDGRNFGGIVATTTAAQEDTTRSTAVFSGACYGVIVDIDLTGDTITILDLVTDKEAQYSYSGSTYIMDKYGKDISVTQLSMGDVVEGGYDTGTKRLVELKKSDRVWENQRVVNFSIDRLANTMKIGKSLYEYMPNVVIVSDGRILEDISEVSNQDELIVRGNEKTIYSIVITRGHGYVTLSDAEYFEGGLVSIGSRIAQEVTPDMIIEVPEGEYVLEITKDGVGGQVDILVTKNQETKVNVGGLKGEVPKTGRIRFQIEPEDATLYIDGEKTDYTELVKLDYGSYKIRLVADGYVNYEADLVVSESYQRREIELGRTGSATESTDGEKETTDNGSGEGEMETSAAATTTETGQQTAQSTDGATTTPAATAQTTSAHGAATPTVTEPVVPTPTVTVPTVTTPAIPHAATEKQSEGMGDDNDGTADSKEIGDYKIHVEAPSGASVYFDGEYMGVAPVSFQKVSGEHTIIFKQSGYETKTYTVTISDTMADCHYSYPTLKPE